MSRRWTIQDVERVNQKIGRQSCNSTHVSSKKPVLNGKQVEESRVKVHESLPPAVKYIIGIDSGVNTGFAMWGLSEKELIKCETLMIHQAMEKILNWHGVGIFVRVEDARLRTFFGDADREQLQGAGSIKRDAKIWEDFLKDHNIDHEFVAPKNNKTKLSAGAFSKITGWKKRTSEHARDAAMLVYGF